MPTDRQLRAFSATLAVLVASALPHSAQADMRTLDTPWVDMSYDDTVLKPSD